jgi:uncharacterized repeat protein (TIGR01451 family)
VVPAGSDLGCNPATFPTKEDVAAESSATDNCGPVTPVVSDGVTTGDDCNKALTFTVTSTDGCSNRDVDTVTYTWTVDTTAPTLANLPTGGDIGCNPETLPICDNSLKASDNCDVQVPVTCSAGEIVKEGAKRTQVFTYSAIDSCGNLATATATYIWIESKPAIQIDKHADVTSAKPGQTINYTYNVTNTGNADLGSLEVTDDNLDVKEVEVEPNSIDSGGDEQ